MGSTRDGRIPPINGVIRTMATMEAFALRTITMIRMDSAARTTRSRFSSTDNHKRQAGALVSNLMEPGPSSNSHSRHDDREPASSKPALDVSRTGVKYAARAYGRGQARSARRSIGPLRASPFASARTEAVEDKRSRNLERE